MLIIVGLAALLLGGLIGVVIGIPVMIAVAVVRARRGPTTQAQPEPESASDPDAAFIDLVTRGWPAEATCLHASDRHGGAAAP
ncbi:MAG: hypothetical protein Q8M17_12965 [Actinomycetota bacterium]|nr:hypothetical protein [Actinomycetota bacterium]